LVTHWCCDDTHVQEHNATSVESVFPRLLWYKGIGISNAIAAVSVAFYFRPVGHLLPRPWLPVGSALSAKRWVQFIYGGLWFLWLGSRNICGMDHTV